MKKRRICEVIKAYKSAYSDPLVVKKGDELKKSDKESKWKGWLWCTNMSGKSGWVPESYLFKSGNKYTALCEYIATELSVNVGDILYVEKEESDWLLCIDSRGRRGWVPAEQVNFL